MLNDDTLTGTSVMIGNFQVCSHWSKYYCVPAFPSYKYTGNHGGLALQKIHFNVLRVCFS